MGEGLGGVSFDWSKWGCRKRSRRVRGRREAEEYRGVGDAQSGSGNCKFFTGFGGWLYSSRMIRDTQDGPWHNPGPF